VSNLFRVGLAICALFIPSAVVAQTRISAVDAKNHIGETATVCGRVASTHYAAQSHRSPTFLNLDEPYPQQIFTILIWGNDRAAFGSPERTYANQRVCVTGRITSYKGVPEIQATYPSQIVIQK
jgi:hypothetical protein